MERFFSLIVALLMLQNGEIIAQEIKKISPVLSAEKQTVTFKSFQKYQAGSAVGNFRGINILNQGSVIRKSSFNLLDQSYFSNQLGFFCRSELKLEKAIRVPLKFRLGSLAYTDYLERKPNAVKP
ncbi:MAG: hypothetical protein ABWZ25_18920 [Chitinophagaceae bacterium]